MWIAMNQIELVRALEKFAGLVMSAAEFASKMFVF